MKRLIQIKSRGILLLFAMCCTLLAGGKSEPLPPVTLNGKPFFPVGCYDMTYQGADKGVLVDPGFLAAGGNIVLIGSLGLPGHPFYKDFRQPILFKLLDQVKNTQECSNLALIIGLDWPLVYDEYLVNGRKRYAPLSEKAINDRCSFLAKDLQKLGTYRNVLGYYLDEPENALDYYYENNFKELKETKKDYGLAEKMVEWTRWINTLIRDEHSNAKLIPGLAWWTTYDYCAEMYDIQAPAHYPSDASNLAEVCYDATIAVNAARRAGGGRTVIYTPAMFNQMDKGWPYAVMTREQERYVCFAPITRGAMGIFGWRLKRCSEKYCNEIVYPVMHEISELSHYFLGEWHDELVQSDHDTSSVPYLQAFKERIRLVAGEEDAKTVKVREAVPDICHCLRKDPASGKYLLLIVSNLRTPATVKFSVDGIKLPAVLVNYFDKTHVKTDGKTFQLEMTPFDTRAFCF